MKIIKFPLSVILIIALSAACLCPTALADEPVQVSSPTVILVEAGSGTIVYEKNAHTPVFPASITKVMTVMLACEYIEDGIISENELVTVTEDAWYMLEDDSMNLGIMPGEEVPFIDLLYCAMLSSANEACNAIAMHACGDIGTFVTEMNRKAAALGCKDTHFVTTNGLHDDNHYTTAYDMYLITAEALKSPLFREIYGTPYYAMPATNESGARYMYHTNRLMNSSHANYYEYCTGGKTGSTSQAGYCLVSTAEKDGITFICVIMGAGRVDHEDGTYTLNTYIDSTNLYNWAFDSFSYIPVISPQESVASIPIYMGDGADAVELVPTEEIVLFLPNEGYEEDLTISVSLYSEAASGNLRAPIDQGEILGEITVYYDGEICGTVKGAAATSIDLKHSEYIKTEISATLSLDWVKNALMILVGVFALYALYISLYITLKVTRRRRNFRKAQRYAAGIRSSAARAEQAAFEEAQSKAKAAQKDVRLTEVLNASLHDIGADEAAEEIGIEVSDEASGESIDVQPQVHDGVSVPDDTVDRGATDAGQVDIFSAHDRGKAADYNMDTPSKNDGDE